MGADAGLIARPFVQAVYGGAEEGVSFIFETLAAELADRWRCVEQLRSKILIEDDVVNVNVRCGVISIDIKKRKTGNRENE